jgi:ubiquinone/menaquinone biosynthesis C-methylase UbiE
MPERTGDLVSIERLIENEDLGIEVLHPGGLALSTEFARQCHIRNGTQVLEVASGTGETACLLAADLGARVKCLDISQHLLLRARRKADQRCVCAGWIRGNAQALPVCDAQFDAVISECAVCNLDKLRALREMQRVARPGAIVGIHDLCWKVGTSELMKQRLKELEGEEPETGEGWKALFEGIRPANPG